jgi:hypothetical protein
MPAGDRVSGQLRSASVRLFSCRRGLPADTSRWLSMQPDGLDDTGRVAVL